MHAAAGCRGRCGEPARLTMKTSLRTVGLLTGALLPRPRPAVMQLAESDLGRQSLCKNGEPRRLVRPTPLRREPHATVVPLIRPLHCHRLLLLLSSRSTPDSAYAARHRQHSSLQSAGPRAASSAHHSATSRAALGCRARGDVGGGCRDWLLQSPIDATRTRAPHPATRHTTSGEHQESPQGTILSGEGHVPRLVEVRAWVTHSQIGQGAQPIRIASVVSFSCGVSFCFC